MNTILQRILFAGLIVASNSLTEPVCAQELNPTPAPRPDEVQMASPVRQPYRYRTKRMLADGRRVLGEELKVTLTEARALSLSRSASGAPRAVNHGALRALHSDIVAIEARHTSSRSWLNGQALALRSRKTGVIIPRSARRFNVVLRPGADVAEVRRALQQHPEVERVDFKRVVEVESVPNDPNYTNQWAPPITGLETGWDVPGRGRIRVAVVDTGVQLSHPEFAGRIIWDDGYADFDSGDAPGSGSGFDHGTHVAGIIAAARNNGIGVAGYSNDIDLMVMNCASWDDDDNKWKISDADDAIDDAVDNGAHIINCSFGFDEDIEDEVEDAYDHSVLVVHAAGNDKKSIAGHWEVPSIALLTITATESSGSPASDTFYAGVGDPWGSNFGPGVDLAAPGRSIYSTVPGGYGYMGGTSMAAPQVSGAAALIMSMNPILIGDESARDLLIRMVEDKGSAGYDEQYGWGVLRLRRAVLQACRDATTFVSSASTFGETGNYDRPWRTLPAALANVPDGATLILNGGVNYAPVYQYPAITITKQCTLSAIPDRPVVIGN